MLHEIERGEASYLSCAKRRHVGVSQIGSQSGKHHNSANRK